MAKSRVVRETQLLSEKAIKELAELNEWAILKGRTVFIILVEKKPYYILGNHDENNYFITVATDKTDLLKNKEEVYKKLLTL